MKLYYFRQPDGSQNFGDDLNPWLWQKLIPDCLDDDEKIAFVGIGTLVNNWLPKHTPNAESRVIFGSGVGYGEIDQIQGDSTYKFYCLRGPLSAQRLGLPPELAVTDGAALIRRVFQADQPKKYRFSYMPHVGQIAAKELGLICQELGMGFIDPRWTTEQVLLAISQTEVLLTEAMHGAIVADALRIPWVPIVGKPRVLSFKWQDWCQSVGLEYQPMYIPRLIGANGQKWPRSLAYSANNWLMSKLAIPKFREIIKTARPFLSQDATIEQLTVTLEERLEQFKNDLKAGVFYATSL
jgi:succinoglycan biosynthesis protein ExoV